MDHPVISKGHKNLRKRVTQVLSGSYYVRRASNIVFVCGGNSEDHMRIKFREYCSDKLVDFDIFFPEYAMEYFLAGEIEEPFDIADFEELIGQLSHAIVIFPEAAGSYAETGYFSAKPQLAKRSILVLNNEYQGVDSFISMGPAKKFSAASIYEPIIQIAYSDPDFDVITKRLERTGKRQHRKKFVIQPFRTTPIFDLFCVIHQIVNLLTVATIKDVIFMMRALYKGHISEPTIRKIASILVGAKYLLEIGDLGHYHPNNSKLSPLAIADGAATDLTSLRLELAAAYQASDADFLVLIEDANNVD